LVSFHVATTKFFLFVLPKHGVSRANVIVAQGKKKVSDFKEELAKTTNPELEDLKAEVIEFSRKFPMP
jgi:hypothetical protein